MGKYLAVSKFTQSHVTSQVKKPPASFVDLRAVICIKSIHERQSQVSPNHWATAAAMIEKQVRETNILETVNQEVYSSVETHE